MKSKHVMKTMLGFYVLLFFGYLFGPILVMAVTAFNTPNYPQAYPLEGFTLDWFVKLWNDRNMMDGLFNSIIIGLCVVSISVPVGLAAASPTGTEIATTQQPMMIELVNPSIMLRSFQSFTNQSSVKPSSG